MSESQTESSIQIDIQVQGIHVYIYVWYFRFKIYNIDSSLDSESMAICSEEGSDSTSHDNMLIIGPPHAASSASLAIEETGDHDDISFFANRSHVPTSHDALYKAICL